MSKAIRTSNTGMQRQSKALWTAAAIMFAVGLHPARASAQGGGGPTDPQIVGIVEIADDIDINYAKLALSKASDKQVKAFAQQMITDHSAVQKAVRDLAAKLSVTPAASGTSDSLKAQAEKITKKLQHLRGKEFEKAYVDNEVAYHKAVTNATKTVLIPSAQNAELKSASQGAEPLFEGHLQHAERVQSAIEGGAKTVAGIAPPEMHSPLMNWVYSLLGQRNLSDLLGVAGIALRYVVPVISGIASLLSVGMFLTTLSFLFTTPGWEPTLKFPAISALPGQFVLKDIVLLGAAIFTASEAFGAVHKSEIAVEEAERVTAGAR